MVRLKNRARQVPGGMNFFDPATRYTPPRFASFDTIVAGVVQARRANPASVKQFGLSVDTVAVANEVDLYVATFCWQKKYFDYIEGEPEGAGAQAARVPFRQPQPTGQPQRQFHGNLNRPATRLDRSTRAVAAGSVAVARWLASGAEAVPKEQSASRASVCAGCPLNEAGDWTSWFTLPAANAIRNFLNSRKAWNLSTPDDDKLNVCGACGCVLKLKVHLPLKDFINEMSPEDKDALWGGCWIRAEQSK